MDVNPSTVATTFGDVGVEHAIATLVLAFDADPVARWIYDDPKQYLLHIPRLFRALGKPSFDVAAAHRTSDGFGIALWLPPGFHGDDHPLEAALAQSLHGTKHAEVSTAIQQAEHHRPSEPHWYLSLIGVEGMHRNKGCGAILLQHAISRCDREDRAAYLWSSDPLNISLYKRHGFEVVDTIQVGSSPPLFPMLRHAR